MKETKVSPQKVLSKFRATNKNPNGFCLDMIDGIEYTSFSRMKKMRRSPGHYKRRYIDGHKDPDTPAKEFGRIMHSALLEPTDFKNRYLISPDKSDYKNLIDTTDDLKATCAELELKATGSKGDLMKRVLEKDDLLRSRIWVCILQEFDLKKKPNSIILTKGNTQMVIEMINQIEAHSSAWKLVIHGASEQSAYWHDKELGVIWFARFDYLRFTKNKVGDITCWLTELKTSKDASPYGFSKEIDTQGYHIQNWIYQRMIEGITGYKVRLVQVILEKDAPYGIATYNPDPRVKETAGWEVQRLLALRTKCEQENRWPVYEERILPIGLPAYAYYRIEEQAERETQ